MAKISFSGHPKSPHRARFFRSLAYLAVALGVIVGVSGAIKAEDAASAPEELTELLSQIEVAANSAKVEEIAAFYSESFTNSDNLSRDELLKSLAQFWSNYSQLNYSSELQSWEAKGEQMVVEVVTQITGVGEKNGREVKLESTLRSRQTLQGQQIINQEILAEQTKLLLGENPPEVTVNLPQQVRPGQKYSFDVIVDEPLAGDLLLGSAIEELVSEDLYREPSKFELEVLPSGGIFKIGRAPLRVGDEWVSAILIRSDGMTIVSQRLKVLD